MHYYLTFKISDVFLAVPIEEVREIARPKSMLIKDKTGVRFVIGHFKLRGDRIPLYDLPAHLSLAHGKNHEVIITEFNGVGIGVRVDKVRGILETEDIIQYPDMISPKSYMSGIVVHNDKMVQVLSLHKIFTKQRLKNIQSYVKKQKL